MGEADIYPIELDAHAIERVLPHRGDILFVKRVTVLAHNQYVGHALWSRDLSILRGHFPGMPLVPGVLLVEAVAQVAGAGMLVGSPCARSMRDDHLGLLAGIRKCSFRRPVHAEEWVRIDVTSRQMTETTASLSGVLRIENEEVASVEILVVNAPRQSLAAAGIARADIDAGT